MKKYLISGILIFVFSIFIYKTFVKERDYNVIIFTLDTTRADYVDTGNGAKAKTPNLKKIAEESIVCENAYTTIPITMPAHTSIFTGKYPCEAGVFNNGENYEKDFPTLAEIFKKRGYTTGAVISLGVLLKEHNLNKGFDYYLDDFSNVFPSYFLKAETVTKRGLKLLKKFRGEKFFLWLHYSDPHEPYAPPAFHKKIKIKLNDKTVSEFDLFMDTEVERVFSLKKGVNVLSFEINNKSKFNDYFQNYPLNVNNLILPEGIKILSYNGLIYRKNIKDYFIKNNSEFIIEAGKTKEYKISFNTKPNLLDKYKIYLYKKEVEYMDKEIGKILSFLKKEREYKNSVIIVVGDHGEGLGEYRHHFGHIHFLRSQYIKVPLFFRFPGGKNRIIKAPVSSVDITPTLLKYMRFKEKNVKFSGIQVFKSKKDRIIFSYTYRPESYLNGISIIHNNFQFIKYMGLRNFEEFIDLNKTKGYYLKDSLIEAPMYLNRIKKMRKLADIELKNSRRKAKRGKLSDKTKEILKSLGYL